MIFGMFVFEKQSKELQDREEQPQSIFIVKDCGMPEFNGKYYVDTDDTAYNSYLCSRAGTLLYRKNDVDDTGKACTIGWAFGFWDMTKNYGTYTYYKVKANGDQPPTSGWEVGSFGLAPPPQLVYEVSNMPSFYLLLYYG